MLYTIRRFLQRVPTMSIAKQAQIGAKNLKTRGGEWSPRDASSRTGDAIALDKSSAVWLFPNDLDVGGGKRRNVDLDSDSATASQESITAPNIGRTALKIPHDSGAGMDTAGFTAAFKSLHFINSRAEELVARHVFADDACQQHERGKGKGEKPAILHIVLLRAPDSAKMHLLAPRHSEYRFERLADAL